jgi:hypothetical protein
VQYQIIQECNIHFGIYWLDTICSLENNLNWGCCRWRYPTSNDFGSEIIPAAAKEFNVQVHDLKDCLQKEILFIQS